MYYNLRVLQLIDKHNRCIIQLYQDEEIGSGYR